MKTDLVRGASAGAVGVWAMDVLTWAVYKREDPSTLLREKQVRTFGKDPAHALAQRIAQLAGRGAAQTEPNAAGIAIHAGLGMLPGAVYPMLRRRLPWLRSGNGTVYGLALFIVNDEIAGRLLRIMGPQKDYPARTHVRGLLGHLMLGVATEMTLNVLEQNTPAAEDGAASAAAESSAGWRSAMFRRGRGRDRDAAPRVGIAPERAPRAAPSALDPDRAALLVIDPVNDFLSEGGAAWDVTKTVVQKHDVVAHLRQAIAGARARRVPVVFAPMAFTDADYDDGTLQTRSTVNRLMFERRMFLAGSWGADFHPDLRPQADDIVLQPHKSLDVFETDLPQHLQRLGVDHLVIAGMAANQCCESTGRHAMEHGYRVVYLRDAIGADNLAAYEAAIRLNLPLIANAVLDVDDFLAALDDRSTMLAPGDLVQSSDHLKIGRVKNVVPPDAGHPGHVKLRKGVFVRRTFYAPLDAVMLIGPGRAVVNVPKLLIDKMPWDQPPTAAPGHVAQASTTTAGTE